MNAKQSLALTAIGLIAVAAVVAAVAVAQGQKKAIIPPSPSPGSEGRSAMNSPDHNQAIIPPSPSPAQRPIGPIRTTRSPRSPNADHSIAPLDVQLYSMLNDPDKVYPIEPERVGGKVKPRTPEEEALFQKAAETLKRVRPVPQERLQFFSWVDQPDIPLTRIGWEAMITQVKPTNHGDVVTIRVTPRVIQGKDVGAGCIASVGNMLAEEYVLAHGEVRFVKAYPLTSPLPMYSW